MLNTHFQAATNRALQRKKKISDAAYTYIRGGVSLKRLAYSFGVSENTIADWFCEAIANKYITSDSMCVSIMKKHIAEYEFCNDISNSYLRTMYELAFTNRGSKSPSLAANIAPALA